MYLVPQLMEESVLEPFEGPFVPLGLCSSPLTSYQRHKGHHILKTQIFHIKMMRRYSLSIANPRNLLKLRSTESVLPSIHLIFCHLWSIIWCSVLY